MSKNKKRYRKQKSSFPWLLVVLGGGLLLIAAFFFTRQAGDGGGTPSIQVDQQNIDYGYVMLQFDLAKTRPKMAAAH